MNMKSKTRLTEDPSTKTIGSFVADDYRTAEFFEKYGIDFCCGGSVSLGTSTCTWRTTSSFRRRNNSEKC